MVKQTYLSKPKKSGKASISQYRSMYGAYRK